MVTVGLRIRIAMAMRQETVRSVSYGTKVSDSTVSRMINDAGSITLENLTAVAAHLGVNVEWLIEGRNAPAWLCDLVSEVGQC